MPKTKMQRALEYQGALKPWIDKMLSEDGTDAYKDGILDVVAWFIERDLTGEIIRLNDIPRQKWNIKMCDEVRERKIEGQGKQFWEGGLFAMEAIVASPCIPADGEEAKERRKAAKRTDEDKAIMAQASKLLARFGLEDDDEVEKQCKRSTVFHTIRSPLSKQDAFIKDLSSLAKKLDDDPALSAKTTKHYVRDHMSDGDRSSCDGEREYGMYSFPCIKIELLKGQKVVGCASRHWPPPTE